MAAPASATVFTGHVAATGSATEASRTITGLDVSYDDAAGTLTGTASFAADPTSGSGALLAIFLGTPSGSTCGAPQAYLAVPLDGASAASAYGSSTGTTPLPASRSYAGTQATLAATADSFKGLDYRCIYAKVVDSSQRALSTTDGFGTLTAPAPPPPPPAPPVAPPAAPAPPPAAPAPAPTPRPTTPVKKAPKLALTVSGVPGLARQRHWITARVRLYNIGTASAKHLRLRLKKVGGVRVRVPRTHTWSRIKAGKHVTLRIQLERTSSRSRTVRLTATGSAKLKATTSIVLRNRRLRKIKPGDSSSPTPTPASGPLSGRYFYGFVNHPDYAWDLYGVFFTDDHFAYYGLPATELPHCTSEAPNLSSDGTPNGTGCFPYTYDPATGALQIGSHQGTYNASTDRLDIDDISMYSLSVPAAGARYQTNLVHIEFHGLCGLPQGCTTRTSYLSLSNDGQFSIGSSFMSTYGDGGSTPFVGTSGYPPDEHGTYTVLAGGKVQLNYADGTVTTKSLGIEKSSAGAEDAAGEGVVLGGVNYYPSN